jgi:hypothetical protein
MWSKEARFSRRGNRKVQLLSGLFGLLCFENVQNIECFAPLILDLLLCPHRQRGRSLTVALRHKRLF